MKEHMTIGRQGNADTRKEAHVSYRAKPQSARVVRLHLCVAGVLCLLLTGRALALPYGGKHYAILFSGGGNMTTNNGYYYTSTKRMYEVMTGTLGYEEVYVLFADGKDPAPDLKVGANTYENSDWSFVPSNMIRSATEASLIGTLNDILPRITPRDYFHLWTNDHGGTFTPFGWPGPTEDTVYLVPWGGSWLDGSDAIHDEELASWIKPVMEQRHPFAADYNFFQCYSGGMVDDLALAHPYTQRHFEMSSVPWNRTSIASETGGPSAWSDGIESGLRSTHDLAGFVQDIDMVNMPRYSGQDIDIVTGKEVGENNAPVFEWARQNEVDGDITVNEGQTVELWAEVSDADSGDYLGYPIDDPLDIEINGAVAAQEWAPLVRSRLVSVIYADEGEFTNEFTVRDDTEEVRLTRIVTVLNVSPILVDLTGDLIVEMDEEFGFFASYTDPGVEDVLTCDWDLDADGVYDDCTGRSGAWFFAEVGVHTVSVRVNDGDGGVALGSFDVTLVPEPATLTLLTLGGLAILRRRRNR
jgi:hypothetical protein